MKNAHTKSIKQKDHQNVMPFWFDFDKKHTHTHYDNKKGFLTNERNKNTIDLALK